MEIASRTRFSTLVSLLPGLGYAVISATAAEFLGRLIPIVGAPVSAIVLGLVIAATAGRPSWAVPGLKFSSKVVLQIAVVLLGASLRLSQIVTTGVSSFGVMIGTLAAALVVALGLGRLFSVPARLTLLIGAGTGICGGSAIAAVAPVVRAEEREIAYAMSTIFLFNVIAVVLFPAIGRLLHFSNDAFGLWAGTAINDTSSVVAAGYSYSAASGDYATIVKLTRTTMIIPIVLVLSIITAWRSDRARGPGETAGASGIRRVLRVFPWFILGFLAASLANSVDILTPATAAAVAGAGRFLIVVALAAIGLNADFRRMVATGFRPLALGLAVWVAVALSSLGLQALFR